MMLVACRSCETKVKGEDHIVESLLEWHEDEAASCPNCRRKLDYIGHRSKVFNHGVAYINCDVSDIKDISELS